MPSVVLVSRSVRVLSGFLVRRGQEMLAAGDGRLFLPGTFERCPDRLDPLTEPRSTSTIVVPQDDRASCRSFRQVPVQASGPDNRWQTAAQQSPPANGPRRQPFECLTCPSDERCL